MAWPLSPERRAEETASTAGSGGQPLTAPLSREPTASLARTTRAPPLSAGTARAAGAFPFPAVSRGAAGSQPGNGARSPHRRRRRLGNGPARAGTVPAAAPRRQQGRPPLSPATRVPSQTLSVRPPGVPRGGGGTGERSAFARSLTFRMVRPVLLGRRGGWEMADPSFAARAAGRDRRLSGSWSG